MKPTLALSTCWCSARHSDGLAMAEEIASLGFTHAEFSHGIRITLVPGVLRAVEEGVIKVSSVHNFCPLPTGIHQAAPNLFEPSARDYREHDQWLRHTKRTIDFAAQVGARVMVLHLGSVSFFWFNPARALDAYAERHPGVDLAKDGKYRKRLEAAVKRMRRRMPPFWARVQASIEEIRTHAVEHGVALGFENREAFDELPMDDDFEALIGAMPQPHTAGYWHDTGHAELKERMGLAPQRAQLEKYAHRLLGFHLHDVSAEGHDHQPIGTGTVDFGMVSSFWKPQHQLVLEFSPRLSVDDVKRSKARIEALLKDVP